MSILDCVLARMTMWGCGALLAAGLLVMQVLLGGWWFPALAAPGYLLVGGAAVVAGAAFWQAKNAPGAWCVGITLVFAGYLLWRQSWSPDWYAAREDQWLLLGAVTVYGVAAWFLRENGVRWLVVGSLLVMATVQIVIVVAQFAAEAPFHPFPEMARILNLSHGDQSVNAGWVTGTFANRTSVSGVLEFTTFLSLGLLVWGRGGAALKLLLLWFTVAGFAGLALCLSRSAYLGVFAGLVVFMLASFFVWNRGVPGHRHWLAGAGALVAVVAALGLWLGIRSESFVVQQRLSSLLLDDFREKLWFLTVPPMLKLQPWTGAGANMFDQLASRYRGEGFEGLPIHAHNDWLQLRIEYGWIGLGLGLLFFFIHFSAGWRNAMRMAQGKRSMGLMPQGMSLGLCIGALAGFATQGIHALFDYGAHIPAVTLLIALGAGWLAGTREEPEEYISQRLPAWMRPLALMPALFGAVLLWQVGGEFPSERKAWIADNAIRAGDAGAGWDEALEGLELDPRNPRLLILAGESATLLGSSGDDPLMEREWYWRAAQYFSEAARERPFYAYALREQAISLDRSGHGDTALPVHLRAIGRDPDQARGYEYLAFHYWITGRHSEAGRLFHLAMRLPGARLSYKYLPVLEADEKRSRTNINEKPPNP